MSEEKIEMREEEIEIGEIKTKNENSILKQKCNMDIFTCILYAIATQLYFISLGLLQGMQTIDLYIKISYTVFILIAILIFEVAYKKDDGILSIYGIEFIFLAIHILLIERITNAFELDRTCLIIETSYIWPIYYCLKAIIIKTRENAKKLKEMSDISEIVKEEKPTKKVAKKRKK